MTHPLAVEKVISIEPGRGITAAGHIPKDSEFFQDHFPSFPVLPGVLALEMLKQSAEYYIDATRQHEATHCYLKHIQGTRFSTYLKPGDEWESHLRLLSEQGPESHWKAELWHDGKVAVSAKLTLEMKADAGREVSGLSVSSTSASLSSKKLSQERGGSL